MSTHWRVELAICWEDRTWTTEKVELDEDDFAHHEGEPSEGEIWEAANDRWESEHRAASSRAQVATGLSAWQRDTHDH